MTDGHEVAIALRRAYLTMHRQAEAALSQFDLTANQFVLLGLLDERDGVSQRDLVDRASSDPNTIRPVLKSLVKKGLVRRDLDPGDGRAWLVGITLRGRQTYKRVRKATEDFRIRLISELDDHECEVLLRALDKVATVMSEGLATAID